VNLLLQTVCGVKVGMVERISWTREFDMASDSVECEEEAGVLDGEPSDTAFTGRD
jgi:hypothetical protein